MPNLTQMPIEPHTTHLYTFPIIQHGTHWYHSHSGLQEQIGMYGSFIMKKRTGFRAGIDGDPPEQPDRFERMDGHEPQPSPPDAAQRDRLVCHPKRHDPKSYAEAIKTGLFQNQSGERVEAHERNGRERCGLRPLFDERAERGSNSWVQRRRQGAAAHLEWWGVCTYFWLKWGGGK